MEIYMLVVVILTGQTAMLKMYFLLTNNIQQRTKKTEAGDVVLSVSIAIWGIMLLLN